VPAATPVTTPAASTVWMDGLAVVHVPPVGVPVKVAVVPIHALAVPVIAGNAITVTGVVARHEPIL
jgi:hypothetical protein